MPNTRKLSEASTQYSPMCPRRGVQIIVVISYNFECGQMVVGKCPFCIIKLFCLSLYLCVFVFLAQAIFYLRIIIILTNNKGSQDCDKVNRDKGHIYGIYLPPLSSL